MTCPFAHKELSVSVAPKGGCHSEGPRPRAAAPTTCPLAKYIVFVSHRNVYRWPSCRNNSDRPNVITNVEICTTINVEYFILSTSTYGSRWHKIKLITKKFSFGINTLCKKNSKNSTVTIHTVALRKVLLFFGDINAVSKTGNINNTIHLFRNNTSRLNIKNKYNSKYKNIKIFIHTYTKIHIHIQYLHICRQTWHSIITFTISGRNNS